MAITTYDQIVAGMAGNLNASKRYQRIYPTNITIPSVGSRICSTWVWPSMWRPTTPNNLGAPVTCDSTTPGGFPITAPTAGGTLYVARLSTFSGGGGLLRMYDRAAMVGGFSGTVATTQTITG